MLEEAFPQSQSDELVLVILGDSFISTARDRLSCFHYPIIVRLYGKRETQVRDVDLRHRADAV